MRWEPDARGRLQRAALELFSEQGFAASTVPQITARAGLTTRTFFRHFADKREVVFGGSEIPEVAATLVRAADPALSPFEVVRTVLQQVAVARFSGPKEETVAWRRVIAADDALRDRDARKRADLVAAARDAFVLRGVEPLDAVLYAELGAQAFQVGLERWVAEDSDRPLGQVLDEVLDRLVQLAAGASRCDGGR